MTGFHGFFSLIKQQVYYTVQSPVDRRAFAGFVERSLQNYSGIQAIEWAPLVQQPERLSYEQVVQSEGHPSFKITELREDGKLVRASVRPYHVPVIRVKVLLEQDFALRLKLLSSLGSEITRKTTTE